MDARFNAVGDAIRQAYSGVRAQSISLHDDAGDVLWLSEGAMGPDEHSAVRSAFESFADRDTTGIATEDLGDGRTGVVLRAENDARVLAGAVLLIVDARTLPSGAALLERYLTPEIDVLLKQFASQLRPPLTLENQAMVSDSAVRRKPVTASGAQVPTVFSAHGDGSPPRVAANKASPDLDRALAALRRVVIRLHAQRLVPARRGTRIRRYEVLLRSPASTDAGAAPIKMLEQAARDGLGSMIDRRVLTELLGWLLKHPAVWDNRPAMFSINLSATAIRDEHFAKFVELCLNKATLPRGTIAFELSERVCREHPAGFEQLAATFHGLGCPVAIDDFGWRQDSVDLLRVRGVRMIKLDASLTDGIESDKVKQAQIAGIVQMARVLGMHTVAKRVQSSESHPFLVAMGVDFMQSFALSPPVDLDALADALAKKGAEPAEASDSVQSGA